MTRMLCKLTVFSLSFLAYTSIWADKSNQPLPFEAQQFISSNPKANQNYQNYISALSRIVYYWGYPLVDLYSRTAQLQVNKPGLIAGVIPAAPLNTSSCVANLPATAHWIAPANNDTLYASAFADLSKEPVIVQAPYGSAKRYWTIHLVDAFTNVIYQLGIRAATPGGKYLLVGPNWRGQKPDGFQGMLRMPTNLIWMTASVYAGPNKENRGQALKILNQIGMYPYSKNQPGLRNFNCEAIAKNILPTPNFSRDKKLETTNSQFKMVDPKTFWITLDKALAMNPEVLPDDAPLSDQARILIALYKTNTGYRYLLDNIALQTDQNLQKAATLENVGVQVANGWRHQKEAGHWGTNWFGRAMAATPNFLASNAHDAVYFYRAADNQGKIFDGNKIYTITFPKNNLPPVDEVHGGFWSLTLYDGNQAILANPPNGRTCIGSKNLEANQLKFNKDGSLTIYISATEPTNPLAKANWLPAPRDNFVLLMRAYVPKQSLLNDQYQFPNIVGDEVTEKFAKM